VNEAQETQGRRRITAWSVALWASVVVPYFYLLLLLAGISNSESRVHWLSLSLVVAAVLHYFWFRRVATELERYRILALIGIHVLGFLGAGVIFIILLVVALSQMP
jgi:hypothetical protein